MDFGPNTAFRPSKKDLEFVCFLPPPRVLHAAEPGLYKLLCALICGLLRHRVLVIDPHNMLLVHLIEHSLDFRIIVVKPVLMLSSNKADSSQAESSDWFRRSLYTMKQNGNFRSTALFDDCCNIYNIVSDLISAIYNS